MCWTWSVWCSITKLYINYRKYSTNLHFKSNSFHLTVNGLNPGVETHANCFTGLLAVFVFRQSYVNTEKSPLLHAQSLDKTCALSSWNIVLYRSTDTGRESWQCVQFQLQNFFGFIQSQILNGVSQKKHKNNELPVCNKENSPRLHLNNDKK